MHNLYKHELQKKVIALNIKRMFIRSLTLRIKSDFVLLKKILSGCALHADLLGGRCQRYIDSCAVYLAAMFPLYVH